MTGSLSIAVVEPQMHSLFHSPFNAALLHAILLGFPDARVSFTALPGHASAVRKILAEYSPEIMTRLEWREVEPSRGDSILARWRSNRRILRQALRMRERVVLCSISRMQLFQLKRLMGPKDDVLAVLHGDLERITQPDTERFPTSLFALRRVLLKPQPRGLRYVLLGESIKQNIPPEYAAQFENAVVIDHPYHFPDLPSPGIASKEKQVIIGVFGNAGDGRLLEQVARTAKADNPQIVFRLVGFVANAQAVARLSTLVEDVGVDLLSREEFVRRAESVTYALWLAPAGSFRLRASGTFFDALAYAKPLVYVGNAFLDAYLDHSATFATRCVTTEDITVAVLRLASRHDLQVYLDAQAAMREFRKRFSPQTLAASLPSKFGW